MPAAITCRFHRLVLGLVLALSCSFDSRAAGALPSPTLQDLQIACRILGFQQTPAVGIVDLAVVYDGADPISRREAQDVAALVGSGLSVGDVVLRAVLVEQAALVTATGYGAIFEAWGVDDSLLSAALQRHKVPCFTIHLAQVEHGSCTIAISVDPTVSIVVSQANATAANVHFATAFRMMVREI